MSFKPKPTLRGGGRKQDQGQLDQDARFFLLKGSNFQAQSGLGPERFRPKRCGPV